MNQIFVEEPKHFNYKFLYDMTDEEFDNFNSPVISNVIPEIGSR